MDLQLFDDFSQIPESDSIKDKVPIFALPLYAEWIKKEKDYSTVWFYVKSEEIQLLIPFSIMKRGPFKKGMFLTAVLKLSGDCSIELEKDFLDRIIVWITEEKACDWIQQAPNWAIYRTYPENAVAVPFGSYIIDIELNSVEKLFNNIKTNTRGDIRKAQLIGINLVNGQSNIEDLFELIKNTAEKANISYPSLNQIRLMHEHFKKNIKSCIAYYKDMPQAGVIFYHTPFCIYAMYAGSVKNPARGSNSFLYWHTAIEKAKEEGIKKFDFVGAIINPGKESKDYQIQKFKESLGARLNQGYIWKYVISKEKYFVYNKYVKLVSLVQKRAKALDIIDRVLQDSR
ncbi:MAG: peptidoglycan bridge formation glycyltransferase FemA/FemB family protein [Bacteroidetes bacterium]|nr:MAG: peptidoglycan bridge formation glycyltransferase FemA/FemB family protein [Bacteroidota bacterium]